MFKSLNPDSFLSGNISLNLRKIPEAPSGQCGLAHHGDKHLHLLPSHFKGKPVEPQRSRGQQDPKRPERKIKQHQRCSDVNYVEIF